MQGQICIGKKQKAYGYYVFLNLLNMFFPNTETDKVAPVRVHAYGQAGSLLSVTLNSAVNRAKLRRCLALCTPFQF